MIINDLDCNVEDLSLDDFPNESTETANYIVEQVKLHRIASELFFRHCSPRQLSLYTSLVARQAAQQEIRNALQMWHDSIAQKSQRETRHYLYLTLDLCYQ